MQDGIADWLHRSEGVDVYGATFRGFSGEIHLREKNCTNEFLCDPEEFILASGLFRMYRRETFILNGDPMDRRLQLEFSEDKALKRVILY